ncbi:hypothetical protein [Proteus mirabilis]|uniref:hypothetical protein n=1 Tax=Proteus mirabilis TaxID=584 RepID=UPI0023F83E13|nr:hypothetical protein [Proteus mirabilis]MDF7320526.1 hypothetical protein [Proteus mirabilis]MDM3801668.1 hypothetical protein [Proteus mirabilis]MDM3811309.1 hypothetical protein [Proteus mirabilis]HEK2712620.1 hypothetical protein [Proteus mirabilis]HEK3135004.1 hypothetical protein [Proteus mirabilis]
MTIEQVIDALSKIQFNQSLSLSTYFFIAIISSIVSICSIYITGYLKEKSKFDFIKKNLTEINTQLEKNTETTKSIEHQFIQKTWINQQIWIKKQEIYDEIFKIFLNIDKYLNHEEEELNNSFWFYSGIYQYLYNDSISEEEKNSLIESQKEYKTITNSNEYKEKINAYEKIKQNSIESLTNILQLKALFLSDESKEIISKIIELIKITPQDHEEWEDYVTESIKSFKGYKNELLSSAENELSLLI